MTLDWKTEDLANGLACYRRGRFFDAHEHWELEWLRLVEPEKSFLQALIQVTAAMHHAQGGNRAGAESLLRRALRRLEDCPAEFGEIAVVELRAEILDWIAAVEGGAELPAGVPRIRCVGWSGEPS